jgi:hypothetical protein
MEISSMAAKCYLPEGRSMAVRRIILNLIGLTGKIVDFREWHTNCLSSIGAMGHIDMALFPSVCAGGTLKLARTATLPDPGRSTLDK